MRRRLLYAALPLLFTLSGYAQADRPPRVIAEYALGDGPPGRLGDQGRRVAMLIQDEFGFDVSNVPVHVVDGRTLTEMLRSGGSRVKAHLTLEGLEQGGKVYVREKLGGIDDSTLIHETIHVLSERFAHEANAVGRHSMVEGLTEAMTERLVPPQRQRSTDLALRGKSGYIGYTRFADALASLVGEARLRKCFFKLGLGALARDVDAKLGANTLAKASALLELGDFNEATAMLQR